MSRPDEDARMSEAARRFQEIADAILGADSFIADWLPARAAVTVVCGRHWDTLGHATRTRIGAYLRDAFWDSHRFAITPVRLLTKSNGGGSHMIAVYPPGWLYTQRAALLGIIGGCAPGTGDLPFPEDVL